MKVLIECGNKCIGILDDRNYVTFDQSRPKKSTKRGKEITSYDYAYYSRLDQAVREVARTAADDEAESLGDWLKMFQATVDELTGLFTAEERLLDLRGYSLVKKRPKQAIQANPRHAQGICPRLSEKSSSAANPAAGRALGQEVES